MSTNPPTTAPPTQTMSQPQIPEQISQNTPSLPQIPTALPISQQSTLDYLQSHHIKDALEALLNEVASKKPNNPFQYMSDKLAEWARNKPQSFAPSQQLQNVQPKVVFVLGGPGAGKGTQCSNIVHDFGWVHLSAGDLLREARQKQDETGKMIDNYIKEGKIVPVEVTVNLLKQAMQSQVKLNHTLFLIDGFPRNQDNLMGWEKVMGNYCQVIFVLFFDCPQQIMEDRLLIRGQTSGRTDDNIESIRKRFVTYQESTLPIIQHFEKSGKVHHIDAGQTRDEVYARVKQIFQQLQ